MRRRPPAAICRVSSRARGNSGLPVSLAADACAVPLLVTSPSNSSGVPPLELSDLHAAPSVSAKSATTGMLRVRMGIEDRSELRARRLGKIAPTETSLPEIEDKKPPEKQTVVAAGGLMLRGDLSHSDQVSEFVERRVIA